MHSLFLVRYPDAPLRVPDKGTITIGRAEDNTIILPEPRASRLHARIKWRDSKQKFVLVDLESSNGTFLNGVKIESLRDTPLNDRDKIRISSSVITLRFAEDATAIDNEFKDIRNQIHCKVTEIVDVSEVRAGKPQRPVAIGGDLSHFCPIELFQILETGRKTGLLRLTTPVGEGEFTFLYGRIVTGRFQDSTAEQAVFSVLKCASGPFEFVPLPGFTEKPQITTTTTALLMEGCRLLDEAHANN
jgi:hypothetical protein